MEDKKKGEESVLGRIWMPLADICIPEPRLGQIPLPRLGQMSLTRVGRVSLIRLGRIPATRLGQIPAPGWAESLRHGYAGISRPASIDPLPNQLQAGIDRSLPCRINSRPASIARSPGRRTPK